ncbi:MAG: hypothetical protein ABIH82_05220 [Candidatus Woesearchaeota archaeon]
MGVTEYKDMFDVAKTVKDGSAVEAMRATALASDQLNNADGNPDYQLLTDPARVQAYANAFNVTLATKAANSVGAAVPTGTTTSDIIKRDQLLYGRFGLGESHVADTMEKNGVKLDPTKMVSSVFSDQGYQLRAQKTTALAKQYLSSADAPDVQTTINNANVDWGKVGTGKEGLSAILARHYSEGIDNDWLRENGWLA